MKRRKSMSGHQSAKMLNGEWLTPKYITDALGVFQFDPCAPVKTTHRICGAYFDKTDDGLKSDWPNNCRIWLNPPFGRLWPKFVEKLAAHGNGIALLAARTETKEFFRLVWGKADAICFLKGRPHFCYVDGTPAKANSGVPICLIAYGRQNAARLFNCGLGMTLMIPAGHPAHAVEDGRGA